MKTNRKSLLLILAFILPLMSVSYAQNKAMIETRALRIANKTPFQYTYAEAVELLEKKKDSIPDHKTIKEHLPRFIKKRDAIANISLKPSAPYAKPGSGGKWYTIDIGIKNKSGETIKKFTIDCKILDANGKVLSETRAFVKTTGSFSKMEPKPGDEGVGPKYKGTAKEAISLSVPNKENEWKKSELILREFE